MTEPRTPEWCQDLGTLSDRQLGLLTKCAAAVIAQGAGDDDDAQEIVELPVAALAPDLADALRQAGVPVNDQQIQQLCETGPSNRALAIVLLEQICAVPALRAEVDAAYTARQRMLVADPVTIAAVGLILLVMKLRRIKIGKEGLDVTLDPIRNVMTNVIKDLFGN